MGEPGQLDEALLGTALAPLLERLQGEFEQGLVHARAADSDRLDNTIHGIIDATQNRAFKERLAGLDEEIHRVFDAIEAASADAETVQTLELMKGIVVLTSVMNAIVEARRNAASGPAEGEMAMDLTAARRADSERLDNTIYRIINATRNPAFKAGLNALEAKSTASSKP